MTPPPIVAPAAPEERDQHHDQDQPHHRAHDLLRSRRFPPCSAFISRARGATSRYFLTAFLTACFASSNAPFAAPLASSTLPWRSSFLSPVAAPATFFILPLTLSM